MRRLRLSAVVKGTGGVLAIYLALLAADRWGWSKVLTIVVLVLLALAVGVISSGRSARKG